MKNNIAFRSCIIVILSAFFLTNLSYAQWSLSSNTNVKVVVQLNNQEDEHIVPDGNHGAIITWADFRVNTNYSAIYVQRMDRNGFAKWTSDGVLLCGTATVNHSVPVITEDGVGGAIVVWQDWRNGNKDLFAQRIDSSGNVKWASCGVPVVVNTYDQQSPRVISDGQQGAIIVWQDSVNGNWDVYAQRIDENGAQLWTGTGEAICTSIDDQINPRLDNDGVGGTYITWQDKRSGSDYDVYAQRINSTGAVQWSLNGVAVCALSQTQSNPKIKSDGTTGAYIAWVDKRTGTDYDIYCQHIFSNGTALWTANGVSMCASANNQSAPDMVADVSGVIVAWKDFRNNSHNDIYAQKLNSTGTSLWTTNGVAVTTAAMEQINPDVASDGSGGVIIAWQDSGGGTWDAFSQRINSSGTAEWPANGVAVGNAGGNQTNPKIVSDGSGGAIYVFQDKRNTNFDLFAHHLDASGDPDFIDESKANSSEVRIFPQPAIDHTELSSDIISVNSTFCIFDVTGRDVTGNFKTVFSGEGNIIVRKTFAPEGMYLIRIINKNGNSFSSKLLFQN